MPEDFQDYEEQYNDIINYSGLNSAEIADICIEVKKFFETFTYEYTMQNVVDVIQYTAEIVLSNKTALEAKITSEENSILITVPEAVEMAIEKVIPEYAEINDNNLKL